jgi:uncharacterized phiE125 gp8 family phage protein
MPLSLVTPAAVKPVDLATARAQCRQPAEDENGLLGTYIAAATGRCEDLTGRQLITATWDLWLDGWPCGGVIEVPRPPLQAVTWIKYYDTAGTLTTWASTNYLAQAFAGPLARRGRITLASGMSWPSCEARAGAVVVRFTAGYGTDAASVPAPLVQGILHTIASWYDQREDHVTGTVVTPVPERATRIWLPYKSRPTILETAA